MVPSPRFEEDCARFGFDGVVFFAAAFWAAGPVDSSGLVADLLFGDVDFAGAVFLGFVAFFGFVAFVAFVDFLGDTEVFFDFGSVTA